MREAGDQRIEIRATAVLLEVQEIDLRIERQPMAAAIAFQLLCTNRLPSLVSLVTERNTELSGN